VTNIEPVIGHCHQAMLYVCKIRKLFAECEDGKKFYKLYFLLDAVERFDSRIMAMGGVDTQTKAYTISDYGEPRYPKCPGRSRIDVRTN
jgi:hypothetical protein